MSVLSPIPHGLDYSSFIVNLEVLGTVFNIFFFNISLAILGFLILYVNFRISVYTQKIPFRDFDWDCI